MKRGCRGGDRGDPETTRPTPQPDSRGTLIWRQVALRWEGAWGAAATFVPRLLLLGRFRCVGRAQHMMPLDSFAEEKEEEEEEEEEETFCCHFSRLEFADGARAEVSWMSVKALWAHCFQLRFMWDFQPSCLRYLALCFWVRHFIHKACQSVYTDPFVPDYSFFFKDPKWWQTIFIYLPPYSVTAYLLRCKDALLTNHN